MLFLYEERYGSSKSVRMFEKVRPPSALLNEPTSTCPAGRNRKRSA
jgi:hypothetical protein